MIMELKWEDLSHFAADFLHLSFVSHNLAVFVWSSELYCLKVNLIFEITIIIAYIYFCYFDNTFPINQQNSLLPTYVSF